MKTIEISLDRIEQNENSRVVYKTEDMSELMTSMKHNGLLQPVGVTELENGNYDCIWGNRRVIAARKLGWNTISATVYTAVGSEVDRDLVGLIENMKRENPTATEEGRMFLSLKERGLTISEIASRLDIQEKRIRDAMEMYRVVPVEFRSKVVNVGLNDKRKNKGKIPASIALRIIGMAKANALTATQSKSVFQYAQDNNPDSAQISKIGPLMKLGYSIGEAIDRVNGFDRVSVTVYVPSTNVKKLEKKYGKNIRSIIHTAIQSHSELKVDSTVMDMHRMSPNRSKASSARQ